VAGGADDRPHHPAADRRHERPHALPAGRRTPYFLVGAVVCSLCLFAMPYSHTLWMAASLLWVLDAANNVTMEPYRAYVSDRLDKGQRPRSGFLTQSAFTGLAQTLAILSPSSSCGGA